jgi:hypothetical protein
MNRNIRFRMNAVETRSPRYTGSKQMLKSSVGIWILVFCPALPTIAQIQQWQPPDLSVHSISIPQSAPAATPPARAASPVPQAASPVHPHVHCDAGSHCNPDPGCTWLNANDPNDLRVTCRP